MERKWYQRAIYILIPSVILLIFISLIMRGQGRSNQDAASNDHEKDNRNALPIYLRGLPEELDFAGEKVPLNQIDIKENLDREILVNTFFHSQTLLYIKRANRYFPAIEKILQKYGIPDDLKFMAMAESGLMNAISRSNAVGFWQLLEGTAKEYGLEINNEIDERYHFEKSTEAACRFILESYDKYGTWTMAAASYNAGRKGIDTQIERQKETNYYDLLLAEETSRYIFRILSYKLLISKPSDYGFFLEPDDLYPDIPFYEVTVDGPVSDLAEFAKSYGISYKVLKLMNPWLRETYLSNAKGKTYVIKIPKDGFFKSVPTEKYETLLKEQG